MHICSSFRLHRYGPGPSGTGPSSRRKSRPKIFRRPDAREREIAARERELTARESDLSEERAKNRAIQKELSNTRKAALSTMPAETARIAAVFWGTSDV